MAQNQYKTHADTIQNLILSGKLVPGARLPTHRRFADLNGIALGTATRVYKELKERGLLVGEKGRGVYVRDLGISATLGIEQIPLPGITDLVFNIPSCSSDNEYFSEALMKLSTSKELGMMLRYQPHGGREIDRVAFADHLQTRLGKVNHKNLLIVSGAQHGLSVITLGLFSCNDVIVTDKLTYTGFRAVSALQKLRLLAPNTFKLTVDADSLHDLCCKQKVKAVYLMPTVHNPLGCVMDEKDRKKIVAVARKHDILIIEDGAYAFLENDAPPSFLELAPERTIYVGAFSKSLATGIRVGYVIAPESYIAQLTLGIRVTTWNTPVIFTSIVAKFIENGTLAKLEELRRNQGKNQQLICQDIIDPLPMMAHECGSFVWLPFPQSKRANSIVSKLYSKGVAVSSGDVFAVSTAIPQGIRIAFGNLNGSELQLALEKIVKAIAD